MLPYYDLLNGTHFYLKPGFSVLLDFQYYAHIDMFYFITAVISNLTGKV